MSRRQLVGLGMTPSMLARRLGSSRLLRLHRGVYAVGHARLTRDGEWLAAVLAAGPRAALSHRSAAALHGLLPEPGARVDVTTPARGRTTNWVEVHGRRRLGSDDVVTVRGIAATTVARTLVDLAALVPAQTLERAVNEAAVLGRLAPAALRDALARTRGRHGDGAAALRALLDRHDGPQVLKSELERRFRAVLAGTTLPRPRLNARVFGWSVDALWQGRAVAVELDGWQFHRTPQAFERDRRKERELRAAGYLVLRYSWSDVTRCPRAVVAELGRQLGEPERAGGRAGEPERAGGQAGAASGRRTR